MAESAFQTKVKTWLKQKGCFVLVMTVVPGIPDGMTDILALVPGGGWIALECKKDAKSKYRPLQKMRIKQLNDMYYARRVDPSNWDEIKKELNQII